MRLSALTLLLVTLFCSPVDAAFPEDVTAMLNTDVNPCNDFYLYACGSWLTTHEMVPADVSINYRFDRAESEIRESVKELGAGAAKNESSLVGALWASCMDMEARNALGAEPLQNALTSIVEAQSKHELFVVAGRLARTSADLLVNLAPRPQLANSSQNILVVTSADLTLEDEYYENPEVLAELEQDLSIYASTLLNLTGFSLTSDKDEDEDWDYGEVVLDLEKQFIELQNYDVLDPKTEKEHYVSYADTVKRYPLVFGAFSEGMQLLDGAPALYEDSFVELQSPAYLNKAEELVTLLELDALKAYVAFALVNRFSKYLDESFLAVHFEFFGAAMLGAEQAHPLEYQCAGQVVDLLPAHAGVAYVGDREHMEATDAAFVDMAGQIQEAMKHNIETLEWLDDETRAGALNKLEAVEIMHMQPDQDQLDKEAGGMLKLDPTNFYANVDTIELTRYLQLAWDVNQPVDRGEWGMSAAEVNAYNTLQSNQVVFPAGIMQPPFFDGDDTAAQNFGALGVVVGHELTHGFDNHGAKFDSQGNQQNWWSDATVSEFNTRTQCLVDQYSALSTTAGDGVEIVPVDGDKTLSENIADNGGLRVAYEAYKNFATESASGSESSSSEADQLFFLSYAQTWCTKLRDETAVHSFLTAVHAVGEARVNGAAMNNAAFATAFSCSPGAPMNPIDKCVLW